MILISNEEIKWYKPSRWHFRRNLKRKAPGKSKGSKGHPSLVVGETDDKYANIGLTSSKKRGNHSNYPITDPERKKLESSYLRDDLGLNYKNDLEEVLSRYRLDPKDVSKVLKIIEKYKKKQNKKVSH